MLVLSMLLMNQSMSYSLVISATTSSICLYSVVDADVGIGIGARQLDYLCYFVDNYDYFVKKSCLYAVFITTFFIIIMILYFIFYIK
jgi:hypothetical protein